MTPTHLTLGKILQLEARHGYRDRAVVGGLAAYVARQEADLGPDLALRLGLLFRDYGAMSPSDRAQAVRACLELLAGAAEPKGQTGAGAMPPRRGRSPAPLSPPSGAPAAVPSTDPAQARQLASGIAPHASAQALDPATQAILDRPGRRTDAPALAEGVRSLRGVGPRTERLLAQLGLHTVMDLLLHAPNRYLDYRLRRRIADLQPGDSATVCGLVRRRTLRQLRQGLSLWTFMVEDDSGRLEVSFFNQAHVAKELDPGDVVHLSGKVDLYQGRLTMANPEWEALGAQGAATGRLLPVYPLTEGLQQRWLRRMIGQALGEQAQHLGEPLPPELRSELGLASRPWALYHLHRPSDEAELARARERLAFDELLLLQLWGRRKRLAARRRPAPSLAAGLPTLDALREALPFHLTQAQERCIAEICADLGQTWPMARLLQGDVGSGKTAVAAAAATVCVAAGHQAALMAPTEILADQHYRGLLRLLEPLGYRPWEAGAKKDGNRAEGPRMVRLVGSLSQGTKRAIAHAIARHEVDLVVGTHAVIQRGVSFARLGLAVVDEQHRFGVLQRAELQLKAAGAVAEEGAGEASPDGAENAVSGPPPQAHLLVMTATPIPRTLALALNADLDQSVIDELPAGRQPIQTHWLAPDERERAYAFIRRSVQAGQQAYVVCPLVEDSEQVQARAATAEFERLQAQVFPELRLGLLHGRMRASEKEAVMADFAANRLQVLVATAVIEVGVDVPNATVMLIEGADRFGLAQLHQFRGRVGRGSQASTCLLVADDPGKGASARLRKLTETLPAVDAEGRSVRRPLSGLELAEFDLEQRGPGDFFGVRQSGVVDRFRFARVGPSRALTLAARAAGLLLDRDPELLDPRHAQVAAALAEFTAAAQRG